jgi:hypothetical protein
MPKRLSWKHLSDIQKKGFENIFDFKSIFTVLYVTDICDL